MTDTRPHVSLASMTPHPRLLCTDQDLERLTERVARDPRASVWYRGLRRTARAMLAEPVSRYEIPDGKRLLRTSRRVLKRARYLGLTFRIEGDDALRQRLWQELEAAAHFPDWNPSHFLDTAEMSHAFGLAYDWLYPAWTPGQRALIRDALLQKGLEVGAAAYGDDRPSYAWWVDVAHNWNVVCNGGLGIGALALADAAPEICRGIIQGTVASIPRCAREFGPDGAWDEGPTYWSYTIRYLVPYLAALESALGTDFGLASAPGLDQTGDYPIYITGPSKRTFNYGDASETPQYRGELHWLARRFERPEWAAWHVDQLETEDEGQEALRAPRSVDRSLLWYDNEVVSRRDWRQLPLERHFGGVEVAAMRSAWDDPDALYAAFKAGDNRANHGDLDLGSFVVDARGVRWAVELPSDDYNLPGYFDTRDGGRWQYYRTRAEGQNTLVINPDQGPDQDPQAQCAIITFAAKPERALAVADLSAAYGGHGAQTVRRGVALIAGRSQVLIQDEVLLAEAGEVLWMMHTEAGIELAPGGRRAVLSQNGAQLLALLREPQGAVWSIMPARPLASSPEPEGQQANEGVQKLVVRLRDVAETRLVVQLIPITAEESGQPGSATCDGPRVVPLKQWGATALEAGR